MHQYSIDTRERPRITALLVLLSIAIALLLQKILGIAQINYWWLPAPSLMAIFWTLYFLFSNYLWKFKIFKSIHLVKTPDINGNYKGSISTTHDNHTEPIEAELRIIQTWTTLEIVLKTNQSFSKSYSAHIISAHTKDVIIYYLYLNQPKIRAPETMNIHHGTSFFNISSDGKNLTGEYYSGRGRSNQGSIEFVRNTSDSQLLMAGDSTQKTATVPNNSPNNSMVVL